MPLASTVSLYWTTKAESSEMKTLEERLPTKSALLAGASMKTNKCPTGLFVTVGVSIGAKWVSFA